VGGLRLVAAVVLTLPRGTLAGVSDEYRPWHDLDCPARDVAVRRIAAACTCPQDGRWLNPAAEPVPEAADVAAEP
jgi:hypothetical protein